uniref:CHK kinase-like domain-containing protein n=1 Tax=Anopheles atroparvus TaxID=41427 RepID=A0AAG5DEJ6_ANOAO
MPSIPPPPIRDLEGLLSPVLPAGTRVLGYKAEFLTAPGDNYGSTMLAIAVRTDTPPGKDTERRKDHEQTDGDNCGKDDDGLLHLVAKMRPSSEEFLEIFQIDTTFVKEAAVYLKIVPTLLALQREQGFDGEGELIDVFCRCYNARVSLDPAVEKVDEDGVMLFENLKRAGYVTADRRQGFSREMGRFVLQKLALFHAIPIALRYLKPDVFKAGIHKYLVKIDIDAGLSEATLRQMMDVFRQDIVRTGVEPELVVRAHSQIAECHRRQAQLISDRLSVYCTMLHNDLWVNNMMIKYDPASGKPCSLKFVDFQLIQMDSLVRDVIFFIITSVNDPELETQLDGYFEHYFQHLASNMRRLQFPTPGDFTLESFREEIDRVAPYELYHIVSMLRVVLARKESIPDQSEQDAALFFNDNLVEEDYYRRLEVTLRIYERRGWI